MTDNPLVEAVADGIEEQHGPLLAFSGKRTYAVQAKDLATAALRAIEDAGWKVVKA